MRRHLLSSSSLLLAGGAAAAAALGAAVAPEDAWTLRNPPAPLTMAEEALAGADGPFYPSSARTATGARLDARLFADAEGCGRAGCHPDVAAEWRSSPHRFSGLENPWFRKTFEAFQKAEGVAPAAGRWCAGCHAPALLHTGQIDSLAAADPALARSGVGCTACHGIATVRSSMGQGDHVLDPPPLHDLATSPEPLLRAVHEHLVRVDPAAHRRAYARPVLGSAELCASCHKSHLDEPVNGKGYLREMNDYDAWQANAISGHGARSFYFPDRPRSCVDCHMAAGSHRFAAANTALPALHGDRAQLAAVEAFLKARQVTVDLFALQAPDAAAGAVEAPVVAPLDRAAPAVRRGESRRVTVVVRTRGVGHLFPGGKQDVHDCWLELKGVDARGRVVFWSGRADEGSPVDPGAHFWRNRWVDERGEPIVRRDAWAARGVASLRRIMPSAAEAVHFRLEVPPDAGDTITLTARLNYRKLAWELTRWVFAGEPETPRLPIVTMAEDSVTLRVVDAGAPLPPAPAPASPPPAADVERWNDYGIALWTQRDLRGARAAFDAAVRLAPGFLDGWLNLGQVALAEGDLAAARAALDRAAALAPEAPRVWIYQGLLLKEEGEVQKALELLRKAALRHPRDRVLRNEIVTLLLLEQDYRGAVAELEAILDIDPEDRAAHNSLMLAWRALGDAERAAHHQKLFARFGPMEAGHILNPQFWAAHPHENDERQPIHEHRSAPAAP
jgi:Flp pilus assembly protein TadD